MSLYIYEMKDPIFQEGAKVLRGKATPVLKKDIGEKFLTALIKKMRGTLAGEKYGVAIAAPQVGVGIRLFVVAEKVFEEEDEDDETDGEAESEVAKEKSGRGESRGDPRTFRKQPPMKPHHTIFINPELTRLSRKKNELAEGCLSVRGSYGTVLRHEKATIKAWDEHGVPFIYHASGLLAQIFQHECDHLEGILYIDKAVTLEAIADREESDE